LVMETMGCPIMYITFEVPRTHTLEA
jgi:hypothetical protein